MSIETKKAILSERNQVFEPDFKVQLVESCSLENGILRLTNEEKILYEEIFQRNDELISFFIPASGSGSRMFAFLYKWLEDRIETEEIQSFFKNIERFPFFKELKTDQKDKVLIVNEIVENYAHIPKGLIPFHSHKDNLKTAFQEHVDQINHFFGEKSKIHFTVQKEFERDIMKNIGENFSVSFSFQNDETNAYCFDENQDVVKVDGDFLRRPAGHGALLENLNEIKANIVVLKNIDNVQHFTKASIFKSTTQQLIGILISFKEELKELIANFSVENIGKLNKKYPFLFPDDVSKISKEDLENFSQRPTRVCGMVQNEGEPGGGPFWISSENQLNNQIIEKSQIDFENDNQKNTVNESSHFNPVFIAISKTDINGKQLDLMKFRDDSKFFVVEKNHEGKNIFYRELPGLWNGSMSNWNTLFVEIPLEVFTPVKSVLDLIE